MTLLLEVLGGPRPFRFQVQGAFEPRLEPEWKDGAILSLREVWEIPGARFVQFEDRFWSEWTTFLAPLRQRDPGVSVRLLQDRAGQLREVWRLGPATHEDVRIEQLGARPTPAVESAAWRSVVSVTLTISAVQRFADTEGITAWSQEVASRYDLGGLQILEWRTEIRTREGTSAVEKVRRLGRIDVRPFGERYSYETNGPHGVEVTALDADERTGRIATSALAVSRVRQWGVRVGVSSPAEGPSEVGLSRSTRRTPDGVVTTIRASAKGPQARRWVESKEPPNATSGEVFEELARRQVEAVWTVEGDVPTEEGKARLDVRTELSGGHAGFDFELAVGGYAPVLFEGALLPWRLVVKITVSAQERDQLRWPQLLPDPWRLDHQGSSESEPYREGSRWVREASLLYWSATRPTRSPRELLLSGPKQLEGYVLEVRP